MNKAHESFLNIIKQIEDELLRIAEKFEKLIWNIRLKTLK